MDELLSKYQCRFRKRYNVHHCLLTMIEKWKKAVDNGNVFEIVYVFQTSPKHRTDFRMIW